MYVTYNPEGLGDVLILPIESGKKDEVTHEKFGPIVKIIDQNNNVLGYNIFKASKHLSLERKGKLQLTQSLLDELKQLYKENHLNDSLEFELTPKFLVYYVTSKIQNENAAKISVCQVEVGEETLQLVCGAHNVEK